MQEVYNQLFCLLVFIFTGIAISILFDIFRILRKSFKTSDFITYIQDTLFWILAGAILLFSIFTFNNGEIRSYVFVGMLIGIIFYILVISKHFVKISVVIINFFKKVFYYPIKIVLSFLEKIKENIFSFLNKTNKKIHNSTKFDFLKCKNIKFLNKKKEF